MPVSPKSCFEVVCDRLETDVRCEGGWDEGAPHFETQESAVSYASEYGFLIRDDLVLCPPCKANRECELTTHRWDDWYDAEHLGIRFQRRFCDRCGASDYSPEYDQVVAIVLAEDILKDAARTAGCA